MCSISRPALTLLNFSPRIIDDGAVFALFVIPALFIEGINICISVYLSSFQLIYIPVFIEFIGVCVYALLMRQFVMQGHLIANPLKATAIVWILSASLCASMGLFFLRKIWGKELLHGTTEDNNILAYIQSESGPLFSSNSIKSERSEGIHLTTTLNTSSDKLPFNYHNDHNTNYNTNNSTMNTNSNDKNKTDTTSNNNSNNSSSNSRSGNTKPSTHSGPVNTQAIRSSPRMTSPFPSFLHTHDPSATSSCTPVDTIHAADTVQGWLGSTQKWGEYNKQAIPNFISLLSQSVSWLVISLFAAKLGT
jgi:hypothetical protein